MNNLMKMLSGFLTPIVIGIGGVAALGCVFLAFRCPPLIPVVTVLAFLLLCWLDGYKKK